VREDVSSSRLVPEPDTEESTPEHIDPDSGKRERKFEGPTAALALAPVTGVVLASVAQLSDRAIYGALLVAVLTFVLTIVDDFVDQKDEYTEVMDHLVTPWLKTSIASYAVAAAVGIFADRAGASVSTAAMLAAGASAIIAVVLIVVLGLWGSRRAGD
jgi:hypothetical protein